MDKFFLSVINEEPILPLALNDIKGGGSSCVCYGGGTLIVVPPFEPCKCVGSNETLIVEPENP